MKAYLIAISLLLFSTMIATNCESECSGKPAAKRYKEISKTLSVNAPYSRKYSELSYDEQIDVFLYARNCPDDPRFAPLLISDGKNKIPAMISRINSEEKVWDKAELVLIIIAINKECRCITNDSEEIRKLESVLERLNNDKNIPDDDPHKRLFERNMNSLRNQLVVDSTR